MEFRILGPVEASHDGVRVPLSGTLRHALLAALLLEANRIVPAERLVDTLWESAPPRTAMTSLQVMVHRLRRAFGTNEDRLVTRAPGYLLRVEPGELDLHLFDAYVAQARSALAQAAYQDAARLLRAALALWTGPVLGGVTSLRRLRDEAARLDAQLLRAIEDRIDADLAIGSHAIGSHSKVSGHDLAAEIAELVAAHPTRERMRGQLMLALYRSGRVGEALAAYRSGRDTLVAELGTEPGPELQDLHARIRRNDPRLLESIPAPVTGAETPVPAQLPHDIPAFSGRSADLARLDAFARLSAPTGRTLPVVVIDGMAGVGKTALAVHFAHRIASEYPDGQLHVDLHGFDPDRAPTPVAEALPQLLRGLGVAPAAVPVTTDEQAALYRSTISARRMLVLLDNAATADQVRPLLPGTPGCLVLATSRNRLGSLVVHNGAHLHTIGMLSAEDSYTLLIAVLGGGRVAAEPDASRQLAERSGHLPLALRITAADLASHPDKPIADAVAELAAGALDALRVEGEADAAVRVAFDLSYRQLPPAPQRLFRLLGIAPGSDTTVLAAAALTGSTTVRAARDLDWLVTAHLIERTTPGRYRMHDLIRQYAAERARSEDAAAALDALLAHRSTAVLEATDLLFRQGATTTPTESPALFRDPAEALAWFEAERPNLVATCLHAATHAGASTTWEFSRALSRLFLLRHHIHDWFVTAQAGLAAATRAGDERGMASMRLSLGSASFTAGTIESAGEHFAAAAAHAGRADWPAGHAAAEANLGVLAANASRPRAALRHYERALAIRQDSGDRYAEAVALDNIGGVHFVLGRLTEAIEYHSAALRAHDEVGFESGAALALANLGNAYRELGEYDAALDNCERALATYRRIGSRAGEGQVLCCLADVYAETGRPADAATAAAGALEIAEETGDRRVAAEAHNILGGLETEAGRWEAAITRHSTALRLANDIGYQWEIQESLIGLAAAQRRAGRPLAALASARRALALARHGECRVAHAGILIAIGSAHLDRGARSAAAHRLRDALSISQETGQRQRNAQARILWDRCAGKGYGEHESHGEQIELDVS